ncbi:hypothetical protein OK074_7532 [Actinobacteria bacterium OK074]|nr:hypothetical protein OK074_7532 [Actinobacteria bacterium OK074]
MQSVPPVPHHAHQLPDGPEIWLRGPVRTTGTDRSTADGSADPAAREPASARESPYDPAREPAYAPEHEPPHGEPAYDPAHGVPAYGPARTHRAGPRRYTWVATHGGAGATTLAAVFGGHDAGRAWPSPERGEPASLLLVGRTHASGLAAVVYTIDMVRRGAAPPGLDLDAVVLVADAPGRLPRPLAQRVKEIEALIDVYRVPWVPAWRLGDLSGQPPRECERLARLTGLRSPM